MAPGPSGLPYLGSVRDFAKDALGFTGQCQETYGDIIKLKLFGVEGYLLLHPDQIQHVMVKNNKNYTKATRGVMKLRTVFGTGLLTSEGEFWRRQRRIAQPAFKRGTIGGFVTLMENASVELCESWEQHYVGKPAFDLYEEMMRVTLKIVSMTLLGIDVSEATSSVGHALEDALNITNARLLRPIDIPTWFPTEENRRLKRATRELHTVVHQIISNQRAKELDTSNLLSMLVHARDPETGEGMSDDELRDEVLIMFVAGHETTANTLSWLWYSLSQSPEAEQKVFEEITAIADGDTITLEQLSQLVYTEAVIKETLRLYPPGWWFARRALADDEVGGYFVPEGQHVWMCAYLTHRHSKLWPDPNSFRPQRFLDKNISDEQRFSYFPFGGGPRQCIGDHFAMIEMKIIIASIIKRFRLTLVPDFKVELAPTTTLRPRFGMEMELLPRD